MRGEQRWVTRPLAVEGEALALGPDLDDARPARVESHGLDRAAGNAGKLAIGRLERVLGESGEDVGQQQLLVLLLVVDPERDQLERGLGEGRKSRFERLVDMSAIFADLVEPRAADHPAPRSRMTLAFALVIRVEEEGEALVER